MNWKRVISGVLAAVMLFALRCSFWCRQKARSGRAAGVLADVTTARLIRLERLH